MQRNGSRSTLGRTLAGLALVGHAAFALASSHFTDAEVRKVDKAAGKITLKHGEIKNLDMPGMTMVFQVKDATMLDKVKAGDKVRFTAEKEGSVYILTTLEAAP